MFKKAKRCNFRRRNDSDDEEKEEVQDEPSQEALQPQPCGPGRDSSHTVATETPTVINTLNSHGNGVQTGAMKLPKDKKKKEVRDEPKASLLSFNDEEGITGSD